MIQYHVKPSSKLSQTWLSSLKFVKEGGYFRPADSKHEIGFAIGGYENDFEAEEHLWTLDDMLDFAKWMRIAPDEFPVVNEEAIKKWQSFKTIKL